MTTVNTSTSVYDKLGISSQPTTTKETGVNTIDQAGFLKLMTTQLQYQDPFEPMDNNQMVQQMATFSSLENQVTGNKALQNISDALTGTRLSDAASWIGKSMLVKSEVATPGLTGGYGGQLTLGADAENVSVDLVDAEGKTVKSIDLGKQSKGDVGFYWDGTDGEGNYVAGEALKVRVNGAKPTQTATWATVAAVQSPASGTDAKLITALGQFTPADAIKLG